MADSPAFKMKKIENMEGGRCLSSVVILLSFDIAVEGTTLVFSYDALPFNANIGFFF